MSTVPSPQLVELAPPTVPPRLQGGHATSATNGPAEGNDRLRETFNQFVGETFFGQMIKAMRSTVGEPAYFHGGHGEEVFRSQLDQTIAEYMTEASADRFADPLFRRQFPDRVSDDSQTPPRPTTSSLSELSQLPRR